MLVPITFGSFSIKTKRREIDKEVDPVSDYMDKLIQDIK